MQTLFDRRDPLAITMWDSSWLRRRYAGGGFEDWDKALDELADRGYNAVRIDCFPHLVAAHPNGKVVETFRDPPGQSPHHYGFAYWGNQWTIYINPRASLVEFLRKCEDRKIAVGLSTWFKPTEDRRNAAIEGADELVRVWDETLRFIQDHELLGNVIYVDVLNEYPFGHCMWWLHKTIDTMTQPEPAEGTLNERQIEFYRSFMREVIEKLRSKWPNLPFAASRTYPHVSTYDMDEDLSVYDFLDMHMWISNNPEFVEGSGYREHIASFGRPDSLYAYENEGRGGYGLTQLKIVPSDVHFEDAYRMLLERWQAHREQYEAWFREKIAQMTQLARKWDIPIGNTEGWGMVNWPEHPMLDWEIQKDAGLLACEIASQHGYLFNCSSNMCEPQFLRLWADVEWHRRVTDTIKGIRGSAR